MIREVRENKNIRDKINTLRKNPYCKVFTIVFLSAFVILILQTLLTDGILLMTNDFKTQQIPFYRLTSDALKSGSTISWLTGLGTPIVGSFSFYTYWSPFFRLVSWLPTEWLPYCMAPLLALKFGVAALTSYAYIKRYVNSVNVAFIAAFLYAFSGYQCFNVFYNHFHDVTAFFPLLLLALDELVENKRRGFFALTVSLMLFTNYVFFVGQVIFVVIYYIVKVITKSYTFSVKSFFSVAIEGALGVIAGAVILPAVLFIASNNRIDDRYVGIDNLIYSEPRKYLEIIRGMLFPGDSPLIDPFYYKNSSVRWESTFAYIPVFSLVGVLTFMRKKINHFVSILLIISCIFMFVPLLNSSFNAFSSYYSSRWFYMPVLIGVLATAMVLDNINDYKVVFAKWAKAVAILSGILAVASAIFYPMMKNRSYTYFLYEDIIFLILYVVIAIVSIVLVRKWVLTLKKNKLMHMLKNITVFVCIITFSAVTLINSIGNFYLNRDYLNEFVYSQDLLDDLKTDEFMRVDTTKIHHNAHLWWDIPSMATFNSNISPSEFDFYDSIKIRREMYSNTSDAYYPLRALFSVKYAFYQDNGRAYITGEKITKPMPGFTFVEKRFDFNIYENECYIPMGFTYDKYILEEDFLKIKDGVKRSLVMLKAVVIQKEQIAQFPYLTKLKLDTSLSELTEQNYYSDVNDRKKHTASEFTTTGTGFEAKWTGDTKNLVFFSVPYNDGYKAYINGDEVPIHQIQEGFMGVETKPGKNDIKFVYTPPYQSITRWISALAFLVIIALIVFDITRRRKVNKNNEL